MKRQLLTLFTLTAVLVFALLESGDAAGWGRGGGRGGHGLGRGFATGLGFGAVYDDGNDLTELYRELLRNVPFYALHPPVYYSCPVPRPYGWSPFADPIGTIPPDVLGEMPPLEIVNPYVPSTKSEPTEKKADTTAAVSRQPEPLVIVNPYATAGKALARAEE